MSLIFFMKKLLCGFLSAFLIFNCVSLNVFASNPEHGGGGGARSTVLDQIAISVFTGEPTTYYPVPIMNTVALFMELKDNEGNNRNVRTLISDCNLASAMIGGNPLSGYQVCFNYMFQAQRSGADVLDYMNSYVIKNPETGNYEFGSPEAVQEAEDIFDDSGAGSIGYINRYTMGYQDINPDWFNDYMAYNFFREIVKSHSNNLIKFTNVGNVPYGSVNFYVSEKPLLGGILSDKTTWGDAVTETGLYADDWTPNFMTSGAEYVGCIGQVLGYENSTISVYFLDNTTGSQFSAEIWHGMQSGLKDVDIVGLANSYASSHNCTIDTRYVSFNSYTFSTPSTLDNIYSSNSMPFNDYLIFSGNRLAVPCFETLSDLKKGTVGKETMPVMNTFNGNGINGNVTDSQVQQADQIINNYYDSLKTGNGSTGGNNNGNNGGNNSNDDDDNDTIWDILASAIKHIIDLIIDVLGDGIEHLAGVFEHLVELFDNVGALIGTGFGDLMGAFFPYIPTEWVTVVSLVIGLTLFFWVIRHFF